MAVVAVASAGRPRVPETFADDKQHRRLLAQGANRALAGTLDCTFPVTLTPSATTTTINDSRVSTWTFVGMMPQTADAAAELAAGALFVTCTLGQIVVTHRSAATADRTFTFVIVG